jgi:hypothetical protein
MKAITGCACDGIGSGGHKGTLARRNGRFRRAQPLTGKTAARRSASK